MSQKFSSESAVLHSQGGGRWRRAVALATAATLMLLGLVAGAASPASAAEPVGYVTGWGPQEFLDLPASLASTGATAIASTSSYALTLTPAGEVVEWGPPDQDIDLPRVNGKRVTAIAASASHNVALTSDGKAVVWGYNSRYLDQYPDVDAPSSLDGKTVTAIAAGGVRSAALTSDGKVTLWGESYSGENVVPSSLDGKTVTAIAAGDAHNVALTSDGKITAWGDDEDGQTDVPASLNDKTVTAIAAGYAHTLALTSDGKITAWGDNSSGQAAVPASLDNKTVTAIAAGYAQSLALTSDGRVTAWGDNTHGQTDVPASLDGLTVTAIAVGRFVSLALTQGRSPILTTSPASVKVEVGEDATFTATANGSPPPSVRWQRADDGGAFEDVPDATSTALTIDPRASDDGARFRAVFTNRFGSAATAAATLDVNRAPTAAKLVVAAGYESAAPITLSGTDPDGDSLTYAVKSQPGHGRLTGKAPGLTYTPDDAYSGPDSFTYLVNDGGVNSAAATVSITVAKRPNTAPVAKDLKVTTLFESATAIILSGTDAQDDPLTYAVVGQPEHGELSGNAPTLMYSPDDGYSGADSFTYRVNDGTVDSATATVRLTVAAAESCVPAKPKREFTVSTDERDRNGTIRSPKVKTKKAGELLVAHIAADGSATDLQSVTEVTGGGLTWTLVQRENTPRGTSEIWQAYATEKIRSTRVEAHLAAKGHTVTLTVAGFSRAEPTVGSSAHASGTDSAPQVSLTPQASGSVVWAVGRVVGSRYDPRPASAQKIVHDTTFASPRVGYWTQRTTTASLAGTDVSVRDKAEAASWGYAAVEIRGTCR